MPVAPVWHRPKRSVDVAPMTAYEIISIFIGILALLMSFGIAGTLVGAAVIIFVWICMTALICVLRP